MELNEIQIVELGSLKFYLRYSNRAFMKFEKAEKQDPDNKEKLLEYFYDLARSGAKAKEIEFNLSFEQFCDEIDPFPTAFFEFTEAANKLFGLEEGEKKNPQK
jgi:hypothetical protein